VHFKLMTRMIMLTTGSGEPGLQVTSRPGPDSDAAARSGGPGGTAAGKPDSEGWADPEIIVSAALRLPPPPGRDRRRAVHWQGLRVTSNLN
jgi:hypothetical protein